MSTTEELKRAMYYDLKRVGGMVGETHLYKTFEESLEAYLEALREERAELIVTRGRIIEERDAYLRKLQAFEFANQSTSELLRDALSTVKRQREFIRTLYTSRKTQKSKTATRTQSSTGNVSGDELKRFEGHSAATCLHRWTQVEPGSSLVCRECLVIADVQPRFHPVID